MFENTADFENDDDMEYDNKKIVDFFVALKISDFGQKEFLSKIDNYKHNLNNLEKKGVDIVVNYFSDILSKNIYDLFTGKKITADTFENFSFEKYFHFVFGEEFGCNNVFEDSEEVDIFIEGENDLYHVKLPFWIAKYFGVFEGNNISSQSRKQLEVFFNGVKARKIENITYVKKDVLDDSLKNANFSQEHKLVFVAFIEFFEKNCLLDILKNKLTFDLYEINFDEIYSQIKPDVFYSEQDYKQQKTKIVKIFGKNCIVKENFVYNESTFGERNDYISLKICNENKLFLCTINQYPCITLSKYSNDFTRHFHSLNLNIEHDFGDINKKVENFAKKNEKVVFLNRWNEIYTKKDIFDLYGDLFVIVNKDEAIETANCKWKSYLKMVRNDISTPETILLDLSSWKKDSIRDLGDFTWYIKENTIKYHKDKVWEDVLNNGKFIFKTLDGSGGAGVRIYNFPEEEFEKHEKDIFDFIEFVIASGETKILIQKPVESSFGRCVRVLVANNKIIASYVRKSIDGSPKANVCQGAEVVPYEMNNEWKELVLKTAKVFELDITGVDVLFGENNKPVICEVNGFPGYSGAYKCGVNPIDEISLQIINMFEERK